MHHRSLLATLSCFALLLIRSDRAYGDQAVTFGNANTCTALKYADMSSVQDAPTHVVDAWVVRSGDLNAPFCKVTGQIDPHVGFEVDLPVLHWNGKLVAAGNGGWGGTVNGFACTGAVRRGYACVATDTGHKGGSGPELWAANNLPGQVDFAFRAVHVGSLAAKAIISRYYLKHLSKSYFVGCSTGGYEGLVEAERFPWDFNGIIAGAPDMDEADLTMRQIWAHRAWFDATGKPILDLAAIDVLHHAALDSCDLDDGVKDGLISNPLACKVDPSKLLCGSGRLQNCLTPQQADAARRIYDGPPPPAGRPGVRGALAGSELAWTSDIGGGDTTDADSFFQYMIYGVSPGWTSADYDFGIEYKRLGLASLYSDTNPDLRQFKAAGGKLIVYQGEADVVEQPTAIIDFYKQVEKLMNGEPETQAFLRLFMIPGMNHCAGGAGAFSVDFLSYLEAWSEEGRAPDSLIGAHVSNAYLAAQPLPSQVPPRMRSLLTPDKRARMVSFFLPLPLGPEIPIDFTRPIFPYPAHVVYTHGNQSQASSYAASRY